MADDLKDDNGLDLGLPSPVEMAPRECTILHRELRDIWSELSGARSNLTRLVRMNPRPQRTWIRSDVMRRESLSEL